MKEVRIAQPDVCYVGSLTRALQVADMADQAGLVCVPHSANLSMVTVFTLHLFGEDRQCGPSHRVRASSPIPWKDMYRPALEVRDGRLAVPDGPGWGITVNADWLAKTQRRESVLGGLITLDSLLLKRVFRLSAARDLSPKSGLLRRVFRAAREWCGRRSSLAKPCRRPHRGTRPPPEKCRRRRSRCALSALWFSMPTLPAPLFSPVRSVRLRCPAGTT